MKALCYFTFFLSPFLALGVLYFLYVRLLRVKLRWQALVFALLAIAVGKSLWFSIFGDHMFYPDIASEVVVDAIGCAYSYAMLLAGLALIPPYRWRGRGVVLPVVALLLMVWGSYEALRVPDVVRREIVLPGLPRSFDGLRVAQISDIHCSPAARRHYVADIVETVNALKPDLICITGDFVDGPPSLRYDDLAPLKDLKAPLGVLGCAGNHEFYSNYALWRPIFESWGIRMLDNAHVAFTNGNDVIVVGGVLDKTGTQYRKWDGKSRNGSGGDPAGPLPEDPEMPEFACFDAPDPAVAFSNAPPSTCRILLQHRPINLYTNALNGVNLQLSGHTHGAPLWGTGPLIAAMNEGHAVGLHREEGLSLYVTPGAGQWVGFPIRLGVPSEIALLTLRR
ncbi:MAG: metallophosphoesterase [Kiritimatiellae bacterium]|nr:metallophosphoesterase [Kiritimatiellia bacterium]